MTWNDLLLLLKSATYVDEIDNVREEIAHFLPVVRQMFDYDQNSNYHQYDLWMHCVHTVLGLPRGLNDDMLYLAALLHDIGKPDCRQEGRDMKRQDEWSHYYGHPERSLEIVRDDVLPYLEKQSVVLNEDEKKRLLYYVEHHDDRVSLKPRHLRRHLELAGMYEFKNLMLLEVADAKAHVIVPAIEERIWICGQWATDYADEVLEKYF